MRWEQLNILATAPHTCVTVVGQENWGCLPLWCWVQLWVPWHWCVPLVSNILPFYYWGRHHSSSTERKHKRQSWIHIALQRPKASNNCNGTNQQKCKQHKAKRIKHKTYIVKNTKQRPNNYCKLTNISYNKRHEYVLRVVQNWPANFIAAWLKNSFTQNVKDC